MIEAVFQSSLEEWTMSPSTSAIRPFDPAPSLKRPFGPGDLSYADSIHGREQTPSGARKSSFFIASLLLLFSVFLLPDVEILPFPEGFSSRM